MTEKMKAQIEESYNHHKPYFENCQELQSMCKNCECWLAENHDYEECRDKPCFKFYLAYQYLSWSNAF